MIEILTAKDLEKNLEKCNFSVPEPIDFGIDFSTPINSEIGFDAICG